MITDADVNRLHSCYCKYTGAVLPLRSICDSRRLAWQKFLAEGHTMEELQTVLFYLNRKIQEGWDRACTRFTNLIWDLNKFEEVHAEALAEKRRVRPVPTAKERVSEQWSPTMGAKACPDSCVHISKVLEAMREAAR